LNHVNGVELGTQFAGQFSPNQLAQIGLEGDENLLGRCHIASLQTQKQILKGILVAHLHAAHSPVMMVLATGLVGELARRVFSKGPASKLAG
jgi:hypothetical protein